MPASTLPTPGEEGHEAGAHAVHDHDGADLLRLGKAKGVAQDKEPHGHIQHAQTHYGKAHDAAGGEGHPQALVQAFAGGVGGAGVGGGGDLHADVAGQHGENAAGKEGKGRHPGEHPSAGGKGHHQQQHEHDAKDLEHRAVLVLQIGVGTGTDRRGDLLHALVPFRNRQDPAPLDHRKTQRQDRTQKTENKEFFHRSVYLRHLDWAIAKLVSQSRTRVCVKESIPSKAETE